MIVKPALAAMLASGIVVPEKPALIMPRPAIVKAGHLDMSRHMLLGMPLTMGMLAAASPLPVSLITRMTGGNTVTTSGSSISYSGLDIGTASSTRRVFALLPFNSASNSRTITGVTIGGVTATIHVQATSVSSGTTGAAIASATVPTGTTATVDVTYSGTMNWMTVFVTAVDNLQSTTPTDTGSTTGLSDTTLTISGFDWLADGVVFGVHMNGLTPTSTWTDLTEYFDTAQSSRRASLADLFTTSKVTNETVTVTLSGSPTRSATVIASFR